MSYPDKDITQKPLHFRSGRWDHLAVPWSSCLMLWRRKKKNNNTKTQFPPPHTIRCEMWECNDYNNIYFISPQTEQRDHSLVISYGSCSGFGCVIFASVSLGRVMKLCGHVSFGLAGKILYWIVKVKVCAMWWQVQEHILQHLRQVLPVKTKLLSTQFMASLQFGQVPVSPVTAALLLCLWVTTTAFKVERTYIS